MLKQDPRINSENELVPRPLLLGLTTARQCYQCIYNMNTQIIQEVVMLKTWTGMRSVEGEKAGTLKIETFHGCQIEEVRK